MCIFKIVYFLIDKYKFEIFTLEHNGLNLSSDFPIKLLLFFINNLLIRDVIGKRRQHQSAGYCRLMNGLKNLANYK